MLVTKLLETAHETYSKKLAELESEHSNKIAILNQLHGDLDVRSITSRRIVWLEDCMPAQLTHLLTLAPPLPMYRVKDTFTRFISKERLHKEDRQRDVITSELHVSDVVLDVSALRQYGTTVTAKWDHQLPSGKVVSFWVDVKGLPWRITFDTKSSKYGTWVENARLTNLPAGAQYVRWSNGGPRAEHPNSYTVFWYADDISANEYFNAQVA